MTRLLRRLSAVLTVPAALVAVLFAISNRQITTIHLWPFGLDLDAPVYLITLGVLIAGFWLGYLIATLRLTRHRLAARKLGRKVADLEAEANRLRAAANLSYKTPASTPISDIPDGLLPPA
jgi:uncharacterized integral membrane protein